MPINFAAVHERKPWRKHRGHKSLYAAIDGSDGAKNLLLRIGRVAEKWEKYGPVQCVFVWEDHGQAVYAFRLAATGSGEIDSASPSINRILQFDRRKCCSLQEIDECFKNDSPPGAAISAAAPMAARTDESGEHTSLWPDDLPDAQAYFEGLARQVSVNRYERSLEARAACIAHYGCICQVCEVDFGKRYGRLGLGFIHVHHLVPISSIGSDYRVDPVADLVPVCPNCHAMIHRGTPPLPIERLRRLLHDG